MDFKPVSKKEDCCPFFLVRVLHASATCLSLRRALCSAFEEKLDSDSEALNSSCQASRVLGSACQSSHALRGEMAPPKAGEAKGTSQLSAVTTDPSSAGSNFLASLWEATTQFSFEQNFFGTITNIATTNASVFRDQRNSKFLTICILSKTPTSWGPSC
jgi:hypothetical protein